MSEKKSYTTVDVLKFFFCICVIAIHTHPLSFLQSDARFYMEKLIFRLAVPYFFVASGYFLGGKYENAEQGGQRVILSVYIKRLLYPFVFFTLISVRQIWTNMMLSGETGKVIYILRHLIFSPFNALWFVQALLIGAIIIYPFIKIKNGVNIAVFIGTVLYLFALACSNYYFICENTMLEWAVINYMKYCLSPRNGVLVGFVYMAIGIKCYCWAKKISASKNRRAIVFSCVLAFVLYCVEVAFLHIQDKTYIAGGDFYLVQLTLVPLIFLLSVLYNIKIDNKISVMMRNLSTGMYYLHMPVLWWVSFYLSGNVLIFITVTAISFIICIISYKTEFTKKYYLLR